MNSIKKYFSKWDFTRYFRLGLGLVMLVGYFSTNENLYLVGAMFLSAQAILNFGCVGGSCSAPVAKNSEKQVMKFDEYKPENKN